MLENQNSYLWEVALVIKQVYDATRLLWDEVYDWLVVRVADAGPGDVLLAVLLLLQLKDVLVEIVLQSLICIIYAQLLKTVSWEELEVKTDHMRTWEKGYIIFLFFSIEMKKAICFIYNFQA